VTLQPEGVKWEEADPKISLATRIFAWLVVLRAPFLTATLTPVALGGAWVAYRTPALFSWGVFGLCALGAALLHLCGNTFNDYFDWRSGADKENNEYFLPFSGGSRSIELGLITEKGLLALSIGLLLAATAVGAAILWFSGPMLLAFGAAGAAAGFFYTAPPLRLIARRGLGELTIFLAFGPLMTAGTVFALTRAVSLADFVVGIPLGLLTTAILWINEFPDAASDEKTGKFTAVVALGKEKARVGYVVLIAAAFAAVAVMVAVKLIPMLALIALLAAPLAFKAVSTALTHFKERTLVKANAGTIQVQAIVGILLAIGIGFGSKLPF
jgi:1,4-dihydroxy-2-naphthoate octaprenyltransferase